MSNLVRVFSWVIGKYGNIERLNFYVRGNEFYHDGSERIKLEIDKYRKVLNGK